MVEKFFNNDLNEQGNFRYYPNLPKMSDKQIIALSLSAESLSIDSEPYFLSKLKTDYSDYFPDVHLFKIYYQAEKLSRENKSINQNGRR